MALVFDAPGSIQRRERQRAVSVADLDDHSPGALVDAEVGPRPLAAQTSDQPCLIGCELEILRHATSIGMNAEALTKIR
jgi:hypothetical protein